MTYGAIRSYRTPFSSRPGRRGDYVEIGEGEEERRHHDGRRRRRAVDFRWTWTRIGAAACAVTGAVAVLSMGSSMLSGGGGAPVPGGGGGGDERMMFASRVPSSPRASAGGGGRNDMKDRVEKMRSQKPRFGDLSESDQANLFQSFRTKHGRKYGSDEEERKRLNVFRQNLATIDALNAANPLAMFDVTEYGDNTEDEIKFRRMSAPFSKNTGTLPGGSLPSTASRPSKISVGQFPWVTPEDCAACERFPELAEYNLDHMPESWDWRDYFATPVLNQGYCGSCWAFAAAGDIEGKWFLATGESVELSKQQLIDCDQVKGQAEGCNGGFPQQAMQYVAETGGLLHEEDYPYKNQCAWGACTDGKVAGTPTCDVSLVSAELKSHNVAHISGWQMVAAGPEYEDLMATALVKNGPIALALNAVGMEFYVHGITGCPVDMDGMTYCEAGAIDTAPGCDPDYLDHAVLLVGYGEEDGVPFWVIKNSWGEEWGEDGFYRVARGENHCGLSNMAVTSVVKEPAAALSA
jgi:cathepsin F